MKPCTNQPMCELTMCKQPTIATVLPKLAPYNGNPKDKVTPWWNAQQAVCVTGPDGKAYSFTVFVQCAPVWKASQCEQVKQYGSSYCRSKKKCPPQTRFEIGQYIWPFYPDLSNVTKYDQATHTNITMEKQQYTRSDPYWEKQRELGKFHHSFTKRDGLPYMTPYLAFGSCMSSSEADLSTPRKFPDSRSTCTQRRRLGVGMLKSSAYDMPHVVEQVNKIKTWDVTKAAAQSTCEPLCAAA